MEWSVSISLVTPGQDITFTNTGSGDEYVIDPEQSSGLDGAPRTVPVDPAPGTDGGIVFPGLKRARHIVVVGMIVNRTATAANRNTMEDNLRNALDAILAADGTLSWTPSGGSARSLLVRNDVPLECRGSGLVVKQFSFGLVAADPDF